MITFYLSGHETVDYYDRQVVPHYDIDKPFIYQRGQKQPPTKASVLVTIA